MKVYAVLFVFTALFFSKAENDLNGFRNRSNAYLSFPINLNGYHHITISGRFIYGGTTPAIRLINCHNIHITKNYLGNSTGAGIYLENCYNITIDYNKITKVSTGVYVVNSYKGGIVVNHNQFRNMQGPMPRGQFVQFNNVNGPYNSISYNRGENVFGESTPEDAINLFKSNGTPSSPIRVTGNRIRGGGPSKSGGGVMLGDNGGSYQLASGNILVNPGQYGMAIAGGRNIAIVNNVIYGRAQSFTNVGIYVWGQSGYHCSNITIGDNKVRFSNAGNIENDSWIGPGEVKPSGWATNVWRAPINASVLPSKVLSFKR